ncbi:MAG: flavoprotein [Planctomycetes bacterium]|nr:flavoprotein [Planctomycetota bacterium]
MDVTVIRSTFDLVRADADGFVRDFYEHLLATFPQVRPLFAGTEFDEQRKKLAMSLAAVVASADRPEALEPVLADLGRGHAALGVTPGMYGYVAYSMLATLARRLGDAWTHEAATSWEAALDFCAGRMLAAASAAA